jgi:hypothetical protein
MTSLPADQTPFTQDVVRVPFWSTDRTLVPFGTFCANGIRRLKILSLRLCKAMDRVDLLAA